MVDEDNAAHGIGAIHIELPSSRMLEVVEFGSFSADAAGLLSADELEELRGELATLRQLGSIIKDTNGLRKFRWAAKGKGKRGGVRVIYYYGGDHMPVFLVAIYSKSEKADMTKAEKKAARKYIDVIKEEYRARMTPPKLRVVSSRNRRR